MMVIKIWKINENSSSCLSNFVTTLSNNSQGCAILIFKRLTIIDSKMFFRSIFLKATVAAVGEKIRKLWIKLKIPIISLRCNQKHICQLHSRRRQLLQADTKKRPIKEVCEIIVHLMLKLMFNKLEKRNFQIEDDSLPVPQQYRITKNSSRNDRTTKVIVTKQNKKKLTKVAEILDNQSTLDYSEVSVQTHGKKDVHQVIK
jgi:hypothetical protein